MALFAGQSSVKRSAGTRPNTPIFDEQEEGEIGDDGEGDYLPGEQDDKYEEDDAGQSESQPDVTFVPSQDSIDPFGNTEPSSQGKFSPLTSIHNSIHLKFQLSLGKPSLNLPSLQSFLVSVKALNPRLSRKLDLVYLLKGLWRVTRRPVFSPRSPALETRPWSRATSHHAECVEPSPPGRTMAAPMSARAARDSSEDA